MSICIDWVRTDEDRNDVYRLRYAMLVEKMNYPMVHIDHCHKTLSEPQDKAAHILIARDTNTNTCVGTLRNNILSECYLGVYEELLSLNMLSISERATTSVTSKFVISREHHHHRLLTVRLAITMYIFGLDTRITVDHVAVRENHVRFYERLGYRSYIGKVDHPEGGTLCPLRVEVQDYNHLECVCKPFPGLYRECMDRKETRLPGARIIQE